MTAIEAGITVDDESGVSVAFTKDGQPYQFRSPAARNRAVIRALETAAAEARRLGEDLREHDLAVVQKSRADRLESVLARLRG